MISAEEVQKASVEYNAKHGKLMVIGGDNILSEGEYLNFNQNPDFIAGADWAFKQRKALIDYDANYQEGYDDAKNVVIDKACKWLEDNYPAEDKEEITQFVEQFKQAMKEL